MSWPFLSDRTGGQDVLSREKFNTKESGMRRVTPLAGALQTCVSESISWHSPFFKSGWLWTRVIFLFHPLRLDIFENPYGAPRPTESENPPATKKEIQKEPKTPIIPKSKRSFPKSKRSFPKSERSFPKSKR